jgi:hypothetical protein
MVDLWYRAMRVIARQRLTACWQMKDGAVFWWSPEEAELLPDGFATQPFGYDEIERVTVYREFSAGNKVFRCDWSAVKAGLASAEGVRVVSLEGARPWPSSPPTEALELSAQAETNRCT